MDAAGKDSAIKHVMSGVNPQGCRVYSFRRPSEEEVDHDYMWRCMARLPERGHIGIFNRSYYEETLAVRVHRELLACEHLPPKLVGPKIWQQRFDDIHGAERYLAHNGIVICKFFLHVSKAEQRRRFIARLEEPDKQWKFEPADLTARQNWDSYMHAYEETIRQTATPEAPWHVVPADNKWFTRLVVVGGPDPAAEIPRPPISATESRPPPQAEGGPRRPGAGKALSEAEMRRFATEGAPSPLPPAGGDRRPLHPSLRRGPGDRRGARSDWSGGRARRRPHRRRRRHLCPGPRRHADLLGPLQPDATLGAQGALRRFDHAAIFVMIAGSYTPFLLGGWAGPGAGACWASSG